MGTVSQTNSRTAAEAIWRICWGWSGMHKHFPGDSLISTILNWTKIYQEKNIKPMQSTPVEKTNKQKKNSEMETCVWKCYSWWENLQMDVSRKIQCTILSTTTPASDKLDNLKKKVQWPPLEVFFDSSGQKTLRKMIIQSQCSSIANKTLSSRHTKHPLLNARWWWGWGVSFWYPNQHLLKDHITAWTEREREKREKRTIILFIYKQTKRWKNCIS